MKKLIVLFLVLLIAVGIGFLVQQDAGYILIAYRHTTIETTLWAGIIGILLIFVALYFIIRFIKTTSLLGGRLHNWSEGRKERKARELTDKGLCFLTEGEWIKAENNLADAAKHMRSPLINYLAAAQAANSLEAYDRRNEHLKTAHDRTKNSEVAIGLTQATLQIQARQWEQAIATLTHLQDIAPHHPYILKLQKRVYTEVGDWKQLQGLLLPLRKYKVYTGNKMINIERNTYHKLLQQACEVKDRNTLENTWNGLPRKWQHDAELLTCYTNGLNECGDYDAACTLIESAVKRNWNASLVHNYGLSHSSEPTKQLTTAEKWLVKHPQEYELLLCIGRLSYRAKFYGKAKEFLELCLQKKTSHEVEDDLAEVFIALGDTNAALECYRR